MLMNAKSQIAEVVVFMQLASTHPEVTNASAGRVWSVTALAVTLMVRQSVFSSVCSWLYCEKM